MAEVGESISRMPARLLGLRSGSPRRRLCDCSVENRLPAPVPRNRTRAPCLEAQSFFAGDFRDRTFGREVAVKNDQVAVFFDRIVERSDDGLAGWIRLPHLASVSAMVLAGDGQAIAVQQAGVQQHFHQRTNAANRDQFGHEMLAARLQIGQHRHAFADAW